MIRGYSEGVILYWPMKTEKQKNKKNKKTENRRQKASMTIKSISFPN